jgi:ABC-type sugar transport system substrate-binding protein
LFVVIGFGNDAPHEPYGDKAVKIRCINSKVSAAGLAVLLACGAAPAMAKKSTDPLNVAVLAVNYNSPSINTMVTIALADCKRRGWNCELHDGKGDQVATNNAATNFINRKVDAIVNIASDNNQMAAVIKAANAAKIPFISTFSGDVPGITADIGANGVVDGALTATELKSALNNKGHVVKLNWNVLPVLHDRDSGFKAVMGSAKGIKVTEVEVKVPGQVEDVFNQLTNILASNKDVTGVWVGWDELATPAVRAIERAGMKDKIKVVGMDGIDEVQELLRKPDSPYVLSVGYSHKVVTEKAMQVVADVVDGKKIPFRAQMTRTCLITKDSVPAAGGAVDFKTCTPFSAEVVSK